MGFKCPSYQVERASTDKFFMKYALIFTFLFSMSSYARLPGWRLAREVNGVKVWILESNSDVTGTMEIRELDSKMDWTAIGQKTYFKKLEEKKISMLAFIGITNWKANEYSWTKQKDRHYLKITGSYTDSSQQEILFTEEHAFLSDKTVQLLQTRPSDVPGSAIEAKAILSYMKKEAGVFDD